MSTIAEPKKVETRQALNQLEQLKKFTKGRRRHRRLCHAFKEYAPQDATTNPSLILKAAQMPEYKSLVEKALADNRKSGASREQLISQTLDYLLVLFGLEILKIVPGRVSTETDASLSFDTEALVNKAHHFIELYEKNGIAKRTHPHQDRLDVGRHSRGGNSAEGRHQLQHDACCFRCRRPSPAPRPRRNSSRRSWGASWIGTRRRRGKDFAPAEDPGVVSVKEIYAYYKKFGYATEVMGASFRNVGEILELAGCDLLTISPHLLAELKNSTAPVGRKLSPAMAKESEIERLELDEKKFRWLLNENAMATEKTAEGIRKFAADIVKLEKFIAERL